MNQAAIIHRPTSDYIYPSSRNTLELQLITARGDADEAELWYWMRYETDPAKIRRQRLHVSLQDALHDYYRTTVCIHPVLFPPESRNGRALARRERLTGDGACHEREFL